MSRLGFQLALKEPQGASTPTALLPLLQATAPQSSTLHAASGEEDQDDENDAATQNRSNKGRRRQRPSSKVSGGKGTSAEDDEVAAAKAELLPSQGDATCAPAKTLAQLLSLAARRGATKTLVAQLCEEALESKDPQARQLVLGTMLRNAACLKELVKVLLVRFGQY